MNMQVVGQAVPAIYKLAVAGSAEMPDHKDLHEKAMKTVKATRNDGRSQLEALFSHTKSVEKDQSKAISKALPGKGEKETGHPLLKVAFANAFGDMGIMKSASELGVMYLAFMDEVEKIANPTPIPQVNHELSGFKSLAHSPVGPGRSIASGVGAALKKIPAAAAAVR